MNSILRHPSPMATGSIFSGAFAPNEDIVITGLTLEATGSGGASTVELRVAGVAKLSLGLRAEAGPQSHRYPELRVAVASGELVQLVATAAPADAAQAPWLATAMLEWGRE